VSQRSKAHAKHHYDCPCGRRVWGNGGRASHTRSCLVYLRTMLAAHLRWRDEGVAKSQRTGDWWDENRQRHMKKIEQYCRRIDEIAARGKR